jgi:Rod binding domain-containing protein
LEVESTGKPRSVEEAARQFEALMVQQLMKSVRGDGAEGWLGTGDDQASSVAMDMAEAQFAQAISAQGGLGLSKMIAEGLRKPLREAGSP